MALFIIGTTDIPSPSKFDVEIVDIDASGERNAAGSVVRDRIATKRKLYFTYNVKKQSDLAPILTAMQAEFFNITYPDPWDGTKTITVYVGDRKSTLKLKTDTRELWTEITFNLIER